MECLRKWKEESGISNREEKVREWDEEIEEKKGKRMVDERGNFDEKNIWVSSSGVAQQWKRGEE